MRISIIGLPASGKSTLAQQISEKFAIPHIQLDRFWFESIGEKQLKAAEAQKEISRAYIREKVHEAIAEDSWVSDGFYIRIQPDIADRADTIWYLDLPLRTLLLNHLCRMGKPHRHTELTMWHEISFFFEIIRRWRRTRPKIQAFIQKYPEKLVVLRSRKEITVYINRLVPYS